VALVKSAIALVVVAITAAPATATAADPIAQWSGLIAQASIRFGVPQRWIADVMRAESAGHALVNGRPIRSRVGAMGLMQLMPATWTELRVAYHLGADPDDPYDNILAGAAYLRLLYDRFGYPGLFAAYNAGPGRYGLSLAEGRPLPAETRTYLSVVTGSASEPLPDVPALETLFFPVASRGPLDGSGPASLFVPLTTAPPQR
jgi:soluble lytic murein transglycosylase-like protein